MSRASLRRLEAESAFGVRASGAGSLSGLKLVARKGREEEDMSGIIDILYSRAVRHLSLSHAPAPGLRSAVLAVPACARRLA